MRRRALIRIGCILFLAVALTGCGENTEDGAENISANEATEAFAEVYGDTDENGNLVIEKDDITEDAAFINYDADGVTVQVLAIASADGKVHAAYNTCQTCSPSPMAYFVQEGAALVCQNCGNSFTAEDVGSSAAGCNPMMIENLEETDTQLIIPASDLEGVREQFKNWQGVTK